MTTPRSGTSRSCPRQHAGHAHAALTAYPELTCDGVAPPPITFGPTLGSPLCPDSADAERFAQDVIRQLAGMTPGPFLHLGGDEVIGYTAEEYVYFIDLTTAVAAEAGKTVVGWQELGASDALPAGTIGQYWGYTKTDEANVELMESFLDQGGAIIMSPPDVAYLDQVYPDDTSLGPAGPVRPNSPGPTAGSRPRPRRGRRRPGAGHRGAALDGDRRHDRGRRVPGVPLASARSPRSDGRRFRPTERTATSTSSRRASSTSWGISRHSA